MDTAVYTDRKKPSITSILARFVFQCSYVIIVRCGGVGAPHFFIQMFDRVSVGYVSPPDPHMTQHARIPLSSTASIGVLSALNMFAGVLIVHRSVRFVFGPLWRIASIGWLRWIIYDRGTTPPYTRGSVGRVWRFPRDIWGRTTFHGGILAFQCSDWHGTFTV